jgi:cysteine-rich repeat protein
MPLFVLGGCIAPPAVLPSFCGDGIVYESAGEECDDQGASTTCDIDCTLAVCGDGEVNAMAGEECDTAGSSASCDDDCTVARCGDGLVNPAAGESCDDGNVVAGDGCNADCRPSGICGNGTLDTGEACDDGNVTGGDSCSTSCRLESCGNGTLEPGESCDHGGVPTATCDSDCTPVTCGDGVINSMAGETCDDAGMSATCNHDCTPAACGDGVANAAAGEECDTGGSSASCDHDCTIARCGDGVINATAGETCDASGVSTPSCDRDCTAPACGDDFVNAAAGEECDTASESTLCDADCTAAWCGDGMVNAMAGEECDDGNRVDSDGCSACLVQLDCGNGILNPGEDMDPPPGPSLSVPVDAQTCRYDFTSISQLYCIDACGNWGGGDGCQQEDADALCKLRMDNPASTAISFTIGEATAAPGICCPPPLLEDPAQAGCVPLGVLADRGVAIAVSVHEADLLSTHGPGQVVTEVICTDP